MLVKALEYDETKEYPLHVCSFAEYTILIDALWPDIRLPRQLLAFPFLSSSVIALLVPTVTAYPPLNFYAIHQFVMHGMITAYIVARYAGGEIWPRYAGLWQSVLVLALLAVLTYPLNLAFGTNFMFLVMHSDNPALKLIWNLTGGNGGLPYLLGLAVLIIIVFHLMYALYAALDKRSGKKKR